MTKTHKNLLAALLALILMLGVTSCAPPDIEYALLAADDISEEGQINCYWQVIESGGNFRIVQVYEIPSWYLRYEILSNRGDVVFSQVTSRPAQIRYVSEDVLEFRLSTGTFAWWSQYYHVEDDMLSEPFNGYFHIRDSLIAYLRPINNDEWQVAVRDIFDAESFYLEFAFENSALRHQPAGSYVEYIGNNQIRVTYLSSDGVSYDEYIVLSLSGGDSWEQALLGADFVRSRMIGGTLRDYTRIIENGRAYELFSTHHTCNGSDIGEETWLFISELSSNGEYRYLSSFEITGRRCGIVGGLYLTDINFDGVNDVLVWLGRFGAQYATLYAAFLSYGDSYIATSFDEIPNPMLDRENRRISGFTRNWAASHSFFLYEFVDGALVMTCLIWILFCWTTRTQEC